MAWDFRQQLRSLADGAGRELSRVRQRPFVEALTAAHSLMVRAGGPVDRDAARARLQTFVEHNEALAGFSGEDLRALLDRHEQEADFEPTSAAREWLARVARLRGQDEAARLLVRVAIAVVGGAASLDGGQRRAVAELCQALELPVADFLEAGAPTPPPAPPSPTLRAGATPAAPPGTSARQLRAGERVSLDDLGVAPTEPLELRLYRSGEAGSALDPAAFLLDQQGKVADDRDMVFYNQPQAPGGGVALTATDPVGFTLQLDRLAARVQRLAFTLSTDGAAFSAVGAVELRLANPAGELLVFPLQAPRHGETAMVMGELYRRGAQWRFVAVGQGYRGGLAAMCRQFGLAVED